MNKTTGNEVVSSDFLRVLLALKDNIMKDLHCNDIGIVTSVKENICLCKLLSKPDVTVACTKVNNIVTDVDDIVFIAYLDSNAKNNAQRLNNNQDLRDKTTGKLHAYENAVIVLNYSKQGSGEGVSVDSSFSTTSTNALQNRVITNRFNQVESRLVNVDNSMSDTSTNPVQNKVLYNPVTFAETERQKSKNLLSGIEFKNAWVNATGLVGTPTCSMIANLMKLQPNTQYTYSVNTEMNYMSITGYDANGSITRVIANLPNVSSITFTTLSNEYYVTVTIELKGQPHIAADEIMNYEPQIELGPIRTTYEPYGIITHNNDAPLIFAERERQKCKNLFGFEYNGIFNSTTETAISKYVALKSVYGEPLYITTNDSSYIFERKDSGDVLTYIIFKNLKPHKNYTVSFIPQSVSGSTNVHFLGVYNIQNNLNTRVTKKYTADANGQISIQYGIWFNARNSSLTVSNVQIEEGDVATDYHSYCGEILHVIDIAPILLWKNANPLSSFSESTIQLNDTILNYAFFEIGYKLSNGSNLGEKFYKYSFVESYNGTPADMYYTIQDKLPDALIRRVFAVKIGGSSIHFQSTEYASATDNTKIIPTYVYGYKGV